MVCHVYILESLKDRKFYTGCTANIEKRLMQHNSGRVRSTKGRRPLKLVYFKTFETRAEAMRHEYRLKLLGRAEKMKLVRDFRSR